jgi:hypothetical protein
MNKQEELDEVAKKVVDIAAEAGITFVGFMVHVEKQEVEVSPELQVSEEGNILKGSAIMKTSGNMIRYRQKGDMSVLVSTVDSLIVHMEHEVNLLKEMRDEINAEYEVTCLPIQKPN